MLTALLNLLSDDVLRNASGLGVGVTLVLVSALGVLIAQLGHRGRPLLAALLLCGLFWLVASQRAMVFGATCAEVLVGSSVLIEEGGGNPEPETRLERRAPASWDHAHDARQARWANNTARALFVLFGPSPAAYRGPYPSRAEAARLLCERGETPTVVDGPALLLRGDATYALEPVDGEAILHIEAALGEPLMAISDDALPDLAFTRGGRHPRRPAERRRAPHRDQRLHRAARLGSAPQRPRLGALAAPQRSRGDVLGALKAHERCRYAQGFLLGRPMSVEAAEGLLGG
jgi:hypothetical protein